MFRELDYKGKHIPLQKIDFIGVTGIRVPVNCENLIPCEKEYYLCTRLCAVFQYLLHGDKLQWLLIEKKPPYSFYSQNEQSFYQVDSKYNLIKTNDYSHWLDIIKTSQQLEYLKSDSSFFFITLSDYQKKIKNSVCAGIELQKKLPDVLVDLIISYL